MEGKANQLFCNGKVSASRAEDMGISPQEQKTWEFLPKSRRHGNFSPRAEDMRISPQEQKTWELLPKSRRHRNYSIRAEDMGIAP